MQCPSRDLKELSMPPPLSPQFFIGRESQKDAWVNQLGIREKDIGHEHCKEGVQGRLNLMTGKACTLQLNGIPRALRNNTSGYGGLFFLTSGYKDAFCLIRFKKITFLLNVTILRMKNTVD